MGWEVLINESHDGMFRRFAFFCNTGDRPFGPVFYCCDCTSIAEFYRAWGELKLPDPRRLPEKIPVGSDIKTLWDAIYDIKEYFGEDMTEYRGQ